LERSGRFKAPALLTLTMDRSRFDSPREAHRFVTDDGLVRRLMRFLGVRLWVWVLEFQGKTGTGWPHWHVLIDLSALPRGRVDLVRAWNLWRDKWGGGTVDLGLRESFTDADDAIRYITKYLIKFPEMGFPLWVKESAGLRFFQACRALGAILGRKLRAGSGGSDDDGEGPRRERCHSRTLAEREAECSQTCTAVKETVSADGSVSREFVGSLLVRRGRLAFLVKLGRLRSPVQVGRERRESSGYESTWLQPYLLRDGKLTEKEQLRKLDDELRSAGEVNRCLADIAERQRMFRANSKWLGRTDDATAKLPTATGDIPF